jgi:hypothetical protein
MAYKVTVEGKGYNNFLLASENVIDSNFTVSIGDDVYKFKNSRMARIDPQTKNIIGPILKVEEAIGKRKWKAEYKK